MPLAGNQGEWPVNTISSFVDTLIRMIDPIAQSIGNLYLSIFNLYAFLGSIPGMCDFGGFCL